MIYTSFIAMKWNDNLRIIIIFLICQYDNCIFLPFSLRVCCSQLDREHNKLRNCVCLLYLGLKFFFTQPYCHIRLVYKHLPLFLLIHSALALRVEQCKEIKKYGGGWSGAETLSRPNSQIGNTSVHEQIP